MRTPGITTRSRPRLRTAIGGLVACSALLAFSPAALAGPGSIYVEAPNAPGEIKLDGFKTGVIAPGLLENVAPGSHQVEVLYGCVVGKALVRVAPDTRTDVLLPMTFREGPGKVRVKGVPEGATFYVDDAPVEFEGDPNRGIPAPCGQHTFTIEVPGYRPVTEELVVPVGGWLVLEPTFEPDPAAVASPVVEGAPATAPEGGQPEEGAAAPAVAAGPSPEEIARREERAARRQARRERFRQVFQLSPRVLGASAFTALAGIGVTVGITGYMSWNPAQQTYDAIVAANGEDDATAQAILGNEIRPYATQMWMGFGLAAFGAVGAGTSLVILPGAQGVQVGHTWRF